MIYVNINIQYISHSYTFILSYFINLKDPLKTDAVKRPAKHGNFKCSTT